MLAFLIILLLLLVIVIQKATINGLKIWMNEHYCITPTKKEQTDYIKKAINKWIDKL